MEHETYRYIEILYGHTDADMDTQDMDKDMGIDIGSLLELL